MSACFSIMGNRSYRANDGETGKDSFLTNDADQSTMTQTVAIHMKLATVLCQNLRIFIF